MFYTAANAQTCAGSASLTWTPPTQHTDGTPLTDLTTYRAYWNTSPTGFMQALTIMAPASSAVVDQLCAGTWYFAVTALDAKNVESALSNVASKMVQGGTGGGTVFPPNAPTGFSMTFSPSAPTPALTAGFAFRATSSYVTDAPGDLYVIGDRYPTTRGGVTFGWEASDGNPRDRNKAVARLAGVAQNSTGWPAEIVFRVDVAPGTYAIRLAAGDAVFDNRAFYELRDGTTVLRAQPNIAAPAGQYFDATGVARTAATWSTSNAPLAVTMTGTALRLALKVPASSSSVISYLQVTKQ